MRNTAFFVAGMVLLLVQASLFRLARFVPVPGLVPSLVFPLIVFMGVHEYSLARGAAVAFVLGYATDLVGVAPVGLFTFTYVAIFLLARGAGVRLAAQTTTMQVALALLFALLHCAMVLVLLAIFRGNPWVARSVWPLAPAHAIATAACAPLVFGLARRIHAATAGARGSGPLGSGDGP